MINNYVWIIDDDHICSFTVQKLIEKGQLAQKIDIFKNGQDALDSLQKINFNTAKYPDIILLDINMPIMDGWQFMDKFVKFVGKSAITLYMVSSSIDPRDQEKAKLYTTDIKGFIVKPLTLENIKKLMNTNVPDELDESL
jgi:CheY-like chemotaxis protein